MTYRANRPWGRFLVFLLISTLMLSSVAKAAQGGCWIKCAAGIASSLSRLPCHPGDEKMVQAAVQAAVQDVGSSHSMSQDQNYMHHGMTHLATDCDCGSCFSAPVAITMTLPSLAVSAAPIVRIDARHPFISYDFTDIFYPPKPTRS